MKTIESARRLCFLAISVLVATITLIACQSGPPQISIDSAKAELSPTIVGEAMVTMNIRNQGGSDVLTGFKTDIPGAKASFHVMWGEHMMNVDTVNVYSKSDLEFQKGGNHIMIEDIPRSMAVGSKFIATLVFQKSGEKQVPLTLQEAIEMPMGYEHHMNM